MATDPQKTARKKGEKTAAPIFLAAGDTALVVQYGEVIDPALNRRVRRLAAALASAGLAGVVDLAPTMRSLLIHYDPLLTSQAALIEQVRGVGEGEGVLPDRGRCWVIPVCYEGEAAPDLAEVASATGLAASEVIARHTATVQEVFAMGFLPGFPYLGLLPPAFDLPRRKVPRIRVPARSISVAARQTTIYTLESPGGWWLIGRTPVDFYDPARPEPILVEAGDHIRFEAISTQQAADLRRAVEAGAYQPVCEDM